MGFRNIKQLFSIKSTEAQIEIFNSHCFMLPFPPYPIPKINNLKLYACRFLCKNFFTYNRWQDFVFLDKFPLQEFSFFLGIVTPPPVISNGPSLNKPLFNTCHTVSVLLPFVVQRSTRSHALVTLVWHGPWCRW